MDKENLNIEKIKCSICNEDNLKNDTYCSNCKTKLNSNALDTETKPQKFFIEGEGYATALRIIAWTELVCSCLLAIFFWIKADKIFEDELKTSLQISGGYFIFGGIIIFVLLMTVYGISKNVINMAKNQQ